jgi:REP element-mobilizing transposase RayT
LVELNVQIDHVHLLVKIPPKVSVSTFMGIIKGRTAIRVLNKFRKLKQKPFWGNRSLMFLVVQDVLFFEINLELLFLLLDKYTLQAGY